MNKYIYSVGIDGVCRPYDYHRFWDEVPVHHSTLIEQYEEKTASWTADARHFSALVYTAGEFKMESAGEAVAKLALGYFSVVCLWVQIDSESFGPTGKYVILEGC